MPLDISSLTLSVMSTEKIPPINWRGTSIKDMCKGKERWSFALDPLVPSKYHSILFELPVTLQSPPKPRKRELHLWEDDYVRMPYSEKNLFCVNEDNCDVVKERWKIIKDILSKPIKNSREFETALKKYNSTLPSFEALHYFFDEELDGSNEFFVHTLPKIIALALQLPDLLPSGIPLLRQNHNRSLSMSQQQIACLLANAFLCTFPWKKGVAATYPGVNFVTLFSASSRPNRLQCVTEKLKSLCNYFRRVTQEAPLGVLTFERKFIPRSSMPRWDRLDNNLGNTKIHISSDGTIEDDGLGFLQVDFANKNIGGGVLRYGCVQEEIRFIICPELIISRLFVEQLGNGEAVIITGAERYNNYSGYGDTFEWIGDCQDATPFDVYGRRRTAVCVIDATKFNRSHDQFESGLILRELNKAYVGFSSRQKDNLAPIATGNWGCGAFRGSKQLKTLIQLMACTASNRDLVYYSFGDVDLMESFYNIHTFLGSNQITIAQLWRFLCQFSLKKLNESELYSFIQQAYFDSKKQPTISQFFSRASSNNLQASATPSSVSNKVPMSRSESTLKNSIDDTFEKSQLLSSSSSSEDIIPSSQPEVRLKLSKQKLRRSSDEIVKKLPKTDVRDIFDFLDGNANQSKNTTPVQSTSKNVLSVFDKFTKEKSVDSLQEVIVVQDDEKMEIDEPSNGMAKTRTPSKMKITDFFGKVNKN